MVKQKDLYIPRQFALLIMLSSSIMFAYTAVLTAVVYSAQPWPVLSVMVGFFAWPLCTDVSGLTLFGIILPWHYCIGMFVSELCSGGTSEWACVDEKSSIDVLAQQGLSYDEHADVGANTC